ncbi:uncharacterized protein LOC126784244 [Argentina anserina]|uniref:uncharacterized protein LOC126784244 n=1 Tax=Argentina anserina TaxID=57926 RepID=UPI0021767C4B|nr:uncharacterized protein LOC126784244 [Potentilla anserina]XP_050365689.1 uncharacterized protein LOC126784244 [Potentilla anserina]
MEVQVCGSRLLFERDLPDLIHSLAAAAGTLGEKHVVAQPCSGAHIRVVEDPINEAQVVDRCEIKKTTENKKGIAKSSDNRVEGSIQVLPEQASTSSVKRLQNYKGYFQQNQGSIEFNILFHSRGCLFENRDNQEYAAEEDTTSLLNHLCVMVETLVYGTYTSLEWRRCLELLLQHSKTASISNRRYALPALKHFNPSSTYNICLSHELPLFFISGRYSNGSRVEMSLPPKLCDDNNWRGLVICAKFTVNDRVPLPSVVKLLCHLRSKDYCLNPIPMCSITKVKLLEHLYRGGFVWVTYIPRVFLLEFNAISDVVARMYSNCPILKAGSCGIHLLHRQEEESFRKVITGCCTSFFDDLPRIRDIAVPETLQIGRKWKGGNFPMLEGQIKEFDRDSIYNAIPRTCLSIPSWFGCYTPLTRRQGSYFEWMREWELKLQLPAPSLRSDKSWIGLALCASFYNFSPAQNSASYLFGCRLRTIINDLTSNNEYRILMTPEELKWHSLAAHHHRSRKFLWLSYIPRSWFLHQLNGESALFADLSAYAGISADCCEARYRFVYEHDVEEFKQHCADLHQSVPENDTLD